VGQEYFINSQQLQNKVADLLPSQGGAGSGFDLSASTQIIPVINLTESAEGSNLRQDLQNSLSLSSITHTRVANSTDEVLINNTGYYRVFGNTLAQNNGEQVFKLTDGVTTKVVQQFLVSSLSSQSQNNFDFIVFLPAGVSFTGTSTATAVGGNYISVTTRQIADITGELVNPN